MIDIVAIIGMYAMLFVIWYKIGKIEERIKYINHKITDIEQLIKNKKKRYY